MSDIVKACSAPNNERVYILFTCTFSNGLSGFLRIGIMQTMSPNHKACQLEVNNIKINLKSPCVGKFLKHFKITHKSKQRLERKCKHQHRNKPQLTTIWMTKKHNIEGKKQIATANVFPFLYNHLNLGSKLHNSIFTRQVHVKTQIARGIEQ